MENDAYKLYRDESSLWLHQGRQELINGILDKFLPNSEQQLIEIGAGVGQNIEVLNHHGHVDALEVNEAGLACLKENPHVRDVFPMAFPTALHRTYDVVVAFDVIEHIENDQQAVSWVFDILNESGLFIATVPAYLWLFTDHDRSLGHYRRYSLAEFLALIPFGHEVLASSYFNTTMFPLAAGGRLTWQIKQKILKRKRGKQKIPSSGVISRLFYKILLAEAKLIRRGWQLPYGLSIVVCVKKSSVVNTIRGNVTAGDSA